ncbi:hybrid sensor histidine kinase/response regulator [Calothrix sp. PCC 6303]|uniref:ATP-binding response regulator n=1 Tax=Calothrix sp. PCC 6303 TaxID=1170562 RepID=UPI0002A0558F|nr:hybrid sensor histidine kinase/response regulator [Calothrix sp. PCC 6303]AFZ00919.1 histidine kinase [Calothrix sp. PCC 6303]
MLHYSLYEFILSLPSCQGTLRLATILEMFEQTQCDRIIVLNEENIPIGLLNSACLLRKLLLLPEVDLQQQLGNLLNGSLNGEFIEPIQVISAKTKFEDFCQILKQEHSDHKNHHDLNWIVVDDADNRLLGVLDSLRILKYISQQTITKQQPQRKKQLSTAKSSPSQRQKAKLPTPALNVPSKVSSSHQSPHQHPLIQLLERLPWPLMLQTTSGEVVTQNPAWWQQLGMLKDPEGIRQEVEMVLSPFSRQQQEYTPDLVPQASQSVGSSTKVAPSSSPQVSRTKRATKSQKVKPVEVNAPGRCFLDNELGTCTCVVEVQSGQERVWQFAKIPLDSPESKAYGIDYETTFTPAEAILHANLWLMLATDVTEKQQLCKELAAKNADLIQLNRLKDEFLACISHELKTPLTSVLGLSRLLVEQQLGELNERQARYAGLIHQSGRHLMTVVNDILDLTRMETGQMELTPATVNIQVVCDRAIAEAKTIHQQSSKAPIGSSSNSPTHQFTLNIQPGLEEIVADELRLRQMLVHLFSNALKFTETGGKIGLKISRWEGWIAFTIWDTGIGIPEHQQHLIFQKFQQLENPLTRQFEGTGLGLVLTRALARLHGGDVSFLSREGKGSQFTLLLPPTPAKNSFTDQQVRRWSAFNDSNISNQNNTVNSSKNAGLFRETSKPSQNNNDVFWDENEDLILHGKVPLSQSVPNSNSSQRLVLVVEAVGRYIEDLTEQLTGLGYRVVIARSGCEAVEKARRLQPKAIFLNPLLPLLSGWDVLTLLKSDSATRGIKVIVTATAAEKEQAFTNRADSFLSLPVQHQMLAPTLEALQSLSEPKKSGKDQRETITTNNPLRILRLVEPDMESNSQPFLCEHRIIEVDDFEQADVLSKVWEFDVILLDAENQTALNFLEKIAKRPRLSGIPLVTCTVETTQAASQIEGLSVFPCLASSENEHISDVGKTEALLSVLQIAAGVCCPPSILVVDLTVLPDLPKAKRGNLRKNVELELFPGLQPLTVSHGCEWFQALIQYLQTAGLKSSMARSWAELLQQIRHRSIDLLLVCLSESTDEKQIHSAITALSKLPFKLPPVLVLDRRVSDEEPLTLSESMQVAISSLTSKDDNPFDSQTQVLPRSTSMEELLNRINLGLKGY